MRTRLKCARLRQSAACIEDIDYRHPRGLDKSLMLTLASCRWIHERNNCIITGPTGAGKSYLACALGHKACREGYSVRYYRMPRLFQELVLAKGDGRYPKLLTSLARTDILILDDWGMSILTDEQRRDLLEILEDRYDVRSTLVTSQMPTRKWHEIIGDPTVADAILDRLIHNAYKLNLKGDSMRKRPKASSPSQPTTANANTIVASLREVADRHRNGRPPRSGFTDRLPAESVADSTGIRRIHKA